MNKMGKIYYMKNSVAPKYNSIEEDDNTLSFDDLYMGNKDMTHIPKHVDFSTANSMYRTFHGCENLEELPEDIDTSHVKNMHGCFLNCIKLKTIPKMDVSKVTDMAYAFGWCLNLERIPHLNTINVTSMDHIFFWSHKIKIIEGLHVNKLKSFESIMPSYNKNLKKVVIYASKKKQDIIYKKYFDIRKQLVFKDEEEIEEVESNV